MAKIQFTIQQAGPWPGELTAKRKRSTCPAAEYFSKNGGYRKPQPRKRGGSGR